MNVNRTIVAALAAAAIGLIGGGSAAQAAPSPCRNALNHAFVQQQSAWLAPFPKEGFNANLRSTDILLTAYELCPGSTGVREHLLGALGQNTLSLAANTLAMGVYPAAQARATNFARAALDRVIAALIADGCAEFWAGGCFPYLAGQR
jgi:hypothetical protein